MNSVIVDELKGIKEEEQKADTRTMLYKGYKNTYDFTKFKMCFWYSIKSGIVAKDMGNNELNKLLKSITELKSKARPLNPNTKKRNNALAFLEGMEMVKFQSAIFSSHPDNSG